MRLICKTLLVMIILIWNIPSIILYLLISAWMWDDSYVEEFCQDLMEALTKNLQEPKK